jgi:hypothetical protein
MKKNQVKVPFPMMLATVLVVVAVLGLSYMWIDARCNSLGREIKKKELSLAMARKLLVSEQDRWSNLTSPINLERAIRKYHLGMSMPQEFQIVRIGYRRKSKGASLVSLD